MNTQEISHKPDSGEVPAKIRYAPYSAASFAYRKHAGQFRRDGVTPYITHPEAVANRLKNESDDVKAVAWLHDVLEDTDTHITELIDAGFSDDVIQAVRVLAKGNGSYEDYLAAVKLNPIARRVKVADMLSNLADNPTERQIVKYARGLLYLLD